MVPAINTLSTFDAAALQTKLQESNQTKFSNTTSRTESVQGGDSVVNTSETLSPAFIIDIDTSLFQSQTDSDDTAFAPIESSGTLVNESETPIQNSGVNLADQPFDVLDTNKDGKISLQELLTRSRESNENVITSVLDFTANDADISPEEASVDVQDQQVRNDFFNTLLAIQENALQGATA